MSPDHARRRDLLSRKYEQRRRLAMGILALSLLLAPRVAAETYYVRSFGRDDRDGLSPQTAFGSVRFAAQFLREPGDRLIVGPGTYNEGNITPVGNGTPDLPIVFQADFRGSMTEDFPGPVIIVPPNVPLPPDQEDNRTGFLLFGKHDIVIEGFTIDGAADAGIQVRPHFSTGVDSTRITVRNNVVQNGLLRGIHIIAAGDVTVVGNTVRDNVDSGLSFVSGTGAPLRPSASRNNLERNAVGIAINGTSNGMIFENTIRSGRRAIGVTGSEHLTIAANDIRDAAQAFLFSMARDTDLVENVVLGDFGTSELGLIGTTTFLANQLGNGDLFDATYNISSDRQSTLRLLQNRIPTVRVTGGSRLEVIGNNGGVIRATRIGDATVGDNDFMGLLRVFATGEVEVSGNSLRALELEGSLVRVMHNRVSFDAELAGGTMTVFDNSARFIRIERDARLDEGGISDPFLFSNNTARSVTMGTAQTPMRGGTVEENHIEGRVDVYSRGNLNVQRNEVGNFAAFFPEFEEAPDILLASNTARGSLFSGLIVVGAENAVVLANTASNNGGSGLAVRRTRNLTVIDNILSANATGGIAVGTDPALGGDCNGDGSVTIDEVVVGLSIAQGNLRLFQCDAADFDGDRSVTIDEVIRAVAALLGVIGPEPPTILDGRFLIRGNAIEDNRDFGVKVSAPGSVTAIDNRILRNGQIGIAAQISDLPQLVEITGNVVGSGGGEGVFLSGTIDASVRNNLIFSNGRAGVLLRDAPGASIVNNLIYDNGNDGIAIGVGTLLPSPDAVVSNNTLYANAGWGVTIGTAGAPSIGTTISNNILDRNGLGGIAAQLESLVGLDIGYNLNNDGYSHEVTPSVTDFPANPRFIDPTGPDDVLGGDGFEDDDFHLDFASAAVDAGSATAAELGVTGSAVAGRDEDLGVVDMGFHYGAGVSTAK